MEAKKLIDMEDSLKSALVEKLMEYVKENGTDVTNYERNEFGLDDEDDVVVTKILNFFDDNGCYFPTTRDSLTELEPYNKTADQIQDELSNKFMFWAFQCLYIEIDGGEESLKYYAFYNDGCFFLDDLAEPEHEYVDTLPLEVICKIIDVINYGKTFKG